MATKEEQREYQNRWIQQRRLDWIESQGGKCVNCGSTERLEVDHINPKFKMINPANLWSMSESNERRIRELAKCQVLCHWCHLDKTSEGLTKPLIHGTSNAHGRKGCRFTACKKWDSDDEKAYRLRVKQKKLNNGR